MLWEMKLESMLMIQKKTTNRMNIMPKARQDQIVMLNSLKNPSYADSFLHLSWCCALCPAQGNIIRVHLRKTIRKKRSDLWKDITIIHRLTGHWFFVIFLTKIPFIMRIATCFKVYCIVCEFTLKGTKLIWINK